MILFPSDNRIPGTAHSAARRAALAMVLVVVASGCITPGASIIDDIVKEHHLQAIAPNPLWRPGTVFNADPTSASQLPLVLVAEADALNIVPVAMPIRGVQKQQIDLEKGGEFSLGLSGLNKIASLQKLEAGLKSAGVKKIEIESGRVEHLILDRASVLRAYGKIMGKANGKREADVWLITEAVYVHDLTYRFLAASATDGSLNASALQTALDASLNYAHTSREQNSMTLEGYFAVRVQPLLEFLGPGIVFKQNATVVGNGTWADNGESFSLAIQVDEVGAPTPQFTAFSIASSRVTHKGQDFVVHQDELQFVPRSNPSSSTFDVFIEVRAMDGGITARVRANKLSIDSPAPGNGTHSISGAFKDTDLAGRSLDVRQLDFVLVAPPSTSPR